MKNRTSLVLMELLIMILVFVLAAAVCLNIFVKADQISRQTAQRDEAVLLAQNAAEILKATSGDPELAGQIPVPEGYRIEIALQDSGVPLLGRAEIRIFLENEQMFMLNTGWQEDG